MARWALKWHFSRIDPEEIWEIFPPQFQGFAFNHEASLNFVFGVFLQRVVDVYEDLIEYFGELAHSHEAGYRMGLCWCVFHAFRIYNPMRTPKLIFCRIIYWRYV